MPKPCSAGNTKRLTDPRIAVALLAATVRAAVTTQAWSRNAILSTPRLDAEYYLAWARDIASGDLLGRHGTIGGEPFLLNPLYAYVIAPLVRFFGTSPAPVLVFQTLLAAGTAALAAAAALRTAGRTAAWTAGIAVAFSTALTHLDGYVAVSGLAAFLVAGTCFACAPRLADEERGHGPVAVGVWLGLSALARPVTVLAAPLLAWHFARRERRVAAAFALLAPVALCAGISFARNLAVSGEPVVFTAANGQNLYLGNNADARRLSAMYTDEFRFAPREMHEDAKFRVGHELGREPSRSDISAWYAARALDELRADPVDSLAWYAQKLRWFFSPEEPASSADLDYDRTLTPLLALAFVPTWVLASLAVAGALLSRESTVGPAALVAAHVAACTLTFPLSHYRSPAIPAMAVLAGMGVAAALAGLREGRGRPLAAFLVVAGGVAAVGFVHPRPPEHQEYVFLANRGATELGTGDVDAAERDARAALALQPDSIGAMLLLIDVGTARKRPDESRPWAERIVERQPWNPVHRVTLARITYDQGRRDEALAAMDRLVSEFPWSGTVRADRGDLRCLAGDLEGAREDLRFAIEHGATPSPRAMQRCGLR